MRRLVYTPAALADIDAIWDYSAETWGVDQAESYTDTISDVCRALAVGDLRGRTVDVMHGYMKYPAGRHFVIFRFHDETIRVVRVLHQAMDVARHL